MFTREIKNKNIDKHLIEYKKETGNNPEYVIMNDITLGFIYDEKGAYLNNLDSCWWYESTLGCMRVAIDLGMLDYDIHIV